MARRLEREALQRIVVLDGGSLRESLDSDWIDVQEGQYRYIVIAEDAVKQYVK
jgi:hypothetical protein